MRRQIGRGSRIKDACTRVALVRAAMCWWREERCGEKKEKAVGDGKYCSKNDTRIHPEILCAGRLEGASDFCISIGRQALSISIFFLLSVLTFSSMELSWDFCRLHRSPVSIYLI